MIFTTLGSNSTGSWRWMTNDTCIAADDCPLSFGFSCCRVLSRSTSAGQCSKETSGLGADGSIWTCLKICELSGLGDPTDSALVGVAEDLSCSGTVAMDKVSPCDPNTASHCPQHTVSASCLQLHNFLLSSVLTCVQNEAVSLQSWEKSLD